MEYSCKTRSLQSLANDMTKGRIVLEHKLQRPEGQWNRKQKSDLIDSLIRKYPINPTYGIKEDGKISIIDGVQRLSTVRDFLGDKFVLSKDLEDERIAGKKFSMLDGEIQDSINNAELQIYEISEYTEKDIREMFRRQNAGKPLTYKLLRVTHGTDAFNAAVLKLIKHPFMEKFVTSAQHKNGTDREIIIQTLMLLETDEEHDYTSFRKVDVDNFVESRETISEDIVKGLTKVMDVCNATLDSRSTSISAKPMILYAGYKLIVDTQTPQNEKFIAIVNEFIDNKANLFEWTRYNKSDTTSSANVRGRLAYWNELIA